MGMEDKGVGWGYPQDTFFISSFVQPDFDGLMQERYNTSALAMELRLSCTNPLT